MVYLVSAFGTGSKEEDEKEKKILINFPKVNLKQISWQQSVLFVFIRAIVIDLHITANKNHSLKPEVAIQLLVYISPPWYHLVVLYIYICQRPKRPRILCEWHPTILYYLRAAN